VPAEAAERNNVSEKKSPAGSTPLCGAKNGCQGNVTLFTFKIKPMSKTIFLVGLNLISNRNYYLFK